jgi:hypothetical protein
LIYLGQQGKLFWPVQMISPAGLGDFVVSWPAEKPQFEQVRYFSPEGPET